MSRTWLGARWLLRIVADYMRVNALRVQVT
jgi:hypothetical protein